MKSMNQANKSTPTPDESADGSSSPTEDQKARTEALPDGSDTDAHEGDSEQDTTSGGSPQQP